MPFWKFFLFSLSVLEIVFALTSAPLRAEDSCKKTEEKNLLGLFKKIVHLGRSNEKGRAHDVLKDLPQLPKEIRSEFEKYILELRAYEPEILGLPVYERVYFEYLRAGQDQEAAKKARIYIEDFQDVFDYYTGDVAKVDPAGPDTIYVKHDVFKNETQAPPPAQLRESALHMKTEFVEKLNEGKTMGWVSYEDYINLGAQASFLNTLGITEGHLLAYMKKDPAVDFAILLRLASREIVSAKQGSKQRQWFQEEIFNSDGIFPRNVIVFVKPLSEGYISKERIVVPGTHTFVVEITSHVSKDDAGIYYPSVHARHDLTHGVLLKKVYGGNTLLERRRDFKSWAEFRNIFLPLRKREPEAYRALIENSSYQTHHEDSKPAHILNQLYLNLQKKKRHLQGKKEKAYEKAMAFIAEKVPIEKWQEDKYFYSHRCHTCKKLKYAEDARAPNLLEIQKELRLLQLAYEDTFYEINFFSPIVDKFKDQPVSWVDLENIAHGKIRIKGYRLPEQLALQNFLKELGR